MSKINLKTKLLLLILCIGTLNYKLNAEGNLRGILTDSDIILDRIYHDQWALIIGVNKYQQLNPLEYAVEDAKSMKSLLSTQYGFAEDNILMLLDNEATKDNIEDSFYRLIENTGPNDCVVFYFAGHGETKQRIGESVRDLGYLIPVNGNPERLERTALSMDRIRTISDELPAKSVLFLVDACYGGLAARGQYRSPGDNIDYIKRITKDRARQIITAGKADQQVVEKEEWGHSAFTKALLEGLMELKADVDMDGIIPVFDLFSYLHKRVTKISKGIQTPHFGNIGISDGEFVFLDKHIIAGAASSVFEGFGFLAIPDEPFGAVVRLNDRLLGKRTPVLNEKLPAGYHTVTVSKEGYQDYSERIFVGPNKTTILRPSLKLIEGILNLAHFPKSSKITIDGDLSMDGASGNIPIARGMHTVEISSPGFERIKPFTINVDTVGFYNIPINKLVMKTKFKAFTRSMIFPGWGQMYYEQQKIGVGLGIATALVGGFCMVQQSNYGNLLSEFEKADEDYHNAVSPENIDDASQRRVSLREDLVNNEKMTNIGLYTLGGIYTFNLVELLLSKSFEKKDRYSGKTRNTDFNLGLRSGGVEMSVGVEF